MGDQFGDILAALAERRYFDGEDPQPVEEVQAEAALRDLLPQVAIGGGDHADTHMPGGFVPHSLELAFLHDAEQFGLKFQRDFAHFVQE